MYDTLKVEALKDTNYCVSASAKPLVAVVHGGNGIHYQWYKNGAEVTEGGQSAQMTPSTVEAGTTTYKVVVTDDCGDTEEQSATITVWPGLTADITDPIDGTCIGTTTPLEVTNLNNEGTPSFQWQMSLNGTDSWSDVGTDADTYDAPTDVADTFYYRVTITDDGRTSGCNTLTKETRVLVWPALAATDITGSTDGICPGATTELAVTVNSGSGIYHYAWEQSSDETDWTAATGSTDAATYTATAGEASSTMYYRVTITDSCGNITKGNAYVTSYDLVTATAVPSQADYCQPASPVLTATVTSSNNGPISYRWYTESGGVYTAIADADGGNANPFMNGATTAGSHTYYVKVSDGCSETDYIKVEYNVYETPAGTAAADSAYYCIGSTAVLTATINSASSANETFQWYTTNDPGAAIEGETNQVYTGGNTSTPGLHTYYVRIKDCDVWSEFIEVSYNVYENLEVEDINDQSLCLGDADATQTITANVTAGQGAGHYHYQWQRSNDNGTTYTNIAGAADAATYAAPIDVAGTYFYKVIVTEDAGCNKVEKTMTLTVWPGLTADITDPIDTCKGTTKALKVTNLNGVGPYSYQWQRSATGEEGSWINISGATAAIYNAPINVADTFYYRVNITDNGRTTGDCNTLTKVTRVLVWPALAAAEIADQSVCIGTTQDITAVVTTGQGAGHYHYQWQRWSDASTNYTNIEGAADAATYAAPIDVAGTYFYKVIITEDDGCNDVEKTMTLTVWEPLTVDELANASYCKDATAANLTAVASRPERAARRQPIGWR